MVGAAIFHRFLRATMFSRFLLRPVTPLIRRIHLSTASSKRAGCGRGWASHSRPPQGHRLLKPYLGHQPMEAAGIPPPAVAGSSSAPLSPAADDAPGTLSWLATQQDNTWVSELHEDPQGASHVPNTRMRCGISCGLAARIECM